MQNKTHKLGEDQLMRPRLTANNHDFAAFGASIRPNPLGSREFFERPKAELHLTGLINAVGISALIWAGLLRLLIG